MAKNTLELEDIVLLDESTWMEQQISDATKETRNEIEEIPENSENNTGSGRTPQLNHNPNTSSQKSLQSIWNHRRRYKNSISWRSSSINNSTK